MEKMLQKTAITLVLLGANHALAGGLWLNEYGDFAGGRASAGAAAGTDEAATIIHNPASSTRIEGSQLFGSVGALIPKIEFDVKDSVPFIGDGDGGQAGLVAPAASMAYVFDNGWDIIRPPRSTCWSWHWELLWPIRSRIDYRLASSHKFIIPR